MRIAKRIFVFASVNILIVVTLSVLLAVLGVSPRLGGRELDVTQLAVFCLVWGFGASFISLALSRVMAKWMMGVKVISPQAASYAEREILDAVYGYSRAAGLQTMPEVGIYESPEVNAFATGPTRNRALVAVSTGLLDSMDREAVRGVIAHEVAHIANGDMVTMTLAQGAVNAFVMFLARIAAWFAGQFVEEEKRPMVQFGVTLALEIALGILGMLVVARVSRAREFRADAGGAKLAGSSRMIAALRSLQKIQAAGHPELVDDGRAPALATLKISGKGGGFLKLFSTHPELSDRIHALESASPY
jgi:heat shock protein HtpX